MRWKYSRARTTAVVAAALSVALLAGCTSSEPSTTTSTPPGTDPVDFVYTTFSSDPVVLKMYEDLFAEFQKDYPQARSLTIQTIPRDQYPGQLAVLLSGSKPPDFGAVTDIWSVPSWFDVLYDMSFLRSEPQWAIDDLVPNAMLNLTGPNGEIYAFPTASAPHIVTYNKTAFETAGVETPEELYQRGAWTWSELRRVIKEVVDAGVVEYGLDFPTYAFAELPPYLDRAFGAEWWPQTADGGNECGLTSPQSIAAIQYLHDLIFVDGTFKEPGSTASFPSGNTAIVMAPVSFLNQLASSDFEWGILPQPQGDGVPYNPTNQQSTLGVFKNGQNPELTARLVAYVSGPAAAAYLKGTLVPARASDLAKVPAWTVERFPNLTEADVDRALTGEVYLIATPSTPLQDALVINAAVRAPLDAVWKDAEADVAAALAGVCGAVAPLQR